MAITGTGTQSDPWIVHSYSEIKSCIGDLDSSRTYYIKLGNDIDCNSYGTDFKWEVVRVLNDYVKYVFDLDGHTIKNIQIAPNNCMFTFGASAQCIIKNGKILNVFMNGSNGFCNYTGGLYSYSKLQNVNVSANATGALSYPFYCGFDSCAIYVEGGSYDYSVFDIPSSVGAKMKNTDVLLNNSKGYRLFSDTSTDTVIDCRIRGSHDNFITDLSQSSQNVFNNCVIDLATNAKYVIDSTGGSCTGVINEDKMPSGFTDNGMTRVTSQEIINGDALRAKGFVVVNVSA